MGVSHTCQPSRFRRDCTDFDCYVPLSRFTNPLSRFYQPSGFGRDVPLPGVKFLAIPHYHAFVPLSIPFYIHHWVTCAWSRSEKFVGRVPSQISAYLTQPTWANIAVVPLRYRNSRFLEATVLLASSRRLTSMVSSQLHLCASEGPHPLQVGVPSREGVCPLQVGGLSNEGVCPLQVGVPFHEGRCPLQVGCLSLLECLQGWELDASCKQLICVLLKLFGDTLGCV